MHGVISWPCGISCILLLHDVSSVGSASVWPAERREDAKLGAHVPYYHVTGLILGQHYPSVGSSLGNLYLYI